MLIHSQNHNKAACNLFAYKKVQAALFANIKAACTLQNSTGGKEGIRTLDTLARIHAFQACDFNHSSTFPQSGAIVSQIRHKAKSLPRLNRLIKQP